MFTESLPTNERPFWLLCSGFRASYDSTQIEIRGFHGGDYEDYRLLKCDHTTQPHIAEDGFQMYWAYIFHVGMRLLVGDLSYFREGKHSVGN
jgi:hypothetical protein